MTHCRPDELPLKITICKEYYQSKQPLSPVIASDNVNGLELVELSKQFLFHNQLQIIISS